MVNSTITQNTPKLRPYILTSRVGGLGPSVLVTDSWWGRIRGPVLSKKIVTTAFGWTWDFISHIPHLLSIDVLSSGSTPVSWMPHLVGPRSSYNLCWDLSENSGCQGFRNRYTEKFGFVEIGSTSPYVKLTTPVNSRDRPEEMVILREWLSSFSDL